MKKVIYVLIALFILSTPNVSYAIDLPLPITIYVNSQFIYCDTPAFKSNNTIFVPVRFISESLGINDITWNGEEQSVLIQQGDKSIQLFIGSNKVYVNGYEFEIESKPVLKNGRAMVPLSFVAENFNFTSNYDARTGSLFIAKDDIKVVSNVSADKAYTQEDVLWLARIIHVEARGLSYEGKLAIANVVLNRVKSDSFPDTIYDVIFQPGQFPPAYKDGFSTLEPNQDCIYAAKMALNGENNISSCLFFNHRPFPNKKVYKVIEGEYFFN